MIPNEPIRFFEFFDAITLAALFVVIGVLVSSQYQRTGEMMATISHSVASSRQSSLIFSIAMTVFFPLYYAFIWFWVGPLTHMPELFYYLLIISALCEMTFVWLPAGAGIKGKIHTLMTVLVFFAMLVLPLVIIRYSQDLSSLSRACIEIFFLVTAGLGVLMAAKKLRKYSFAYETIYCVAFLLTISVIAHT